MPTQSAESNRLLFLYADGGALADLNDNLRIEDSAERRRIDFVRLPEMAIQRLRQADNVANVECPKEGRIFFQLGTTSSNSFVAKMAPQWSMMSIPLGMCRYDRAGQLDGRVPFRCRFHAMIGYHLGFLAGKCESLSRSLIVGVISDDAQLVPAIADARDHGLDVRLVWPEFALPAETKYFAERNNVPLLLLENLAGTSPNKFTNHLNTLLKIGEVTPKKGNR